MLRHYIDRVTLKAELVIHAVYRTRQEAMTDFFFYLEGFYNRTGRHSALPILSLADFDVAYAHQFILESSNYVSINPGRDHIYQHQSKSMH